MSVDASVVAEQEVGGDIDVTLEMDPSVELALASGTGRARSLPRENISSLRDCRQRQQVSEYYFMTVTVKPVDARDLIYHIHLSHRIKGHGKVAEWSKACDSSESLPEPIRFLICVCRQGFESPSCQPFYPLPWIPCYQY